MPRHWIAALALTLFAAPVIAAGRPPLNVLLIAVDDLRPDLGTYGAPGARTPNIDALARRGATFTRAYVQQAVCNPSRVNLLTGRRPDTTRVVDLETHFRSTMPDVVTLPQYFRQRGYFTQAFGKVYHGRLDDEPSWSAPRVLPTKPKYGRDTQAALAKVQRQRPGAFGPSWEAVAAADDSLPDGEIAQQAIRVLREVRDRPFFLAIGFYKPHLPFVAPNKYFDLHPPGDILLPKNSSGPRGTDPIALHDSGELRDYSDIAKSGPIPELQAHELIRAYRAATSYADAMVGQVLAELDRLGLRERTIVVLWGDHGYHLGDHGIWAKHTNFEVATRNPLIISAPGFPQAVRIGGFVETVDIYPTLTDLAGLKVPPGLEGVSLTPMLQKPGRALKTAAFSQFPRGEVMGYSMRTDRYRYTEWLRPRSDGGREAIAIELYDHRADPLETVNRADDAKYAGVRKEHAARLRAGWQGALQPAS
jgi:arylsulfatase A-like enzyme